MKVIIAGTRSIANYELVSTAIRMSGFEITEVVSGGCRGVDQMGECWASRHGLGLSRFEAEWDKYPTNKNAAGPIRNKKMADYADALIAVWDGKSRGTRDMILKARDKGLKIYVHRTG